jgi:RNA polymerase sigma factor (TIGR02999 family)
MSGAPSNDVTQLLVAARAGDRAAADALFRAVYADLHRIAARQVARGDGAGHGSTSLVHEAWFRLARPASLALNDRKHFFAVAARAMRQIAVDRAREHLAVKRGSGAPETTLGAAADAATDAGPHEQLVAFDAALSALEALDARLARLVELRFFGGMNLDEAGAALGLSPTTLKRDFRKARAFLHAQLDGNAEAEAPGLIECLPASAGSRHSGQWLRVPRLR